MAKKREIEALREENSRLAALMDRLRLAPEREAIAALRELRQTTTAEDPASFLPHSVQAPFTLPLASVSAPTQGSIEFELMIRHAIAYPTLAPLDAPATGDVSRSMDVRGKPHAIGLRYYFI